VSAARRLAAIAIGALVATAFVPAVAQAAQPSTSSPSVISTLRAELRAGTLGQTTHVVNLCAQVHAACQLLAVAPQGSSKPLSTTEPVGYGATDLETAYHLPPNWFGQNGTIAIIDAGAYPVLESDLNTYRAQYGLPACTTASGCLKITDLHGGPPLTPDPTQLGQEEEELVAVETSLDVEMASAACPGCHIMELQLPVGDAFPQTLADADAATADFGTAVNTAVSLGANAISMSYGYPTDAFTDTGTPAQDLFHPGVAILASSGDSGFNGTSSAWPQDLPTVTSVGGTSLIATNTAGTKFTQTAWNAAGSSCTTDLPAAVGQPAAIAGFCAGHRAGADISADADPSTGPAIYDTYAPFSGQPINWTTVGGTSASSPFVAGVYARAGHLSGVLGPNTLYAARKGTFTDVTLGQNAPRGACQADGFAVQVCQAGAGWDGPTGLGTPNGLAGF
jgi:subtilase family serine protease